MKQKNVLEFINGIFSDKDKIAPAYINTNNPKYIEIDNMYYSGIIIVNYYREYNDLILKKILESNLSMNISIFYEKQDTYKTIRDLTHHIASVGVDLKETNQNRQDIDIAAFTYSDAKYIRKEIQVNNEDLYFLYIYLDIFLDNSKKLEYVLNKIEGILQSSELQTRRANFRQEQIYLSCLPVMENNQYLKSAAKRNVLTDGIISTYPFISFSIFDEAGIFIGTNIYNNSLVFVDRYNSEKYKNANMCIFGTSGSGKSFYTKLLILRYRLLGIEQYVIDPEREYTNLANAVNGTILKIGPNLKTYINVLEIRKESIEEQNGYLATKISKLIGFFNLIFGELDEEEKAILEEKLIKCYKQKNITFEDDSLYKQEKNKISIKPVFKESSDMPLLEDLYNILGEYKKTKKLQIKLLPFINGSLRFFNNYTNIEINNKLIIADVYDLGEENLKFGMYLFTDINLTFLEPVKKHINERIKICKNYMKNQYKQ